MNSRQIELFLSVAECLNFTRASQENHVSQPTVSRQIAQLEEEWGVELFYREQNTVRLTAAGSAIAAELKLMSKQFHALLDTVRDTKESVSGNLTIGHLNYLNTDVFVYAIIAEFSKRYPNVKIKVQSASFPALKEGLINGDYDLIFIYSLDLCFVKNVQHINCCPVSHMIAISSTHPLADQKETHLSDLSGETFLLPESQWQKNRENDIRNICKRFHIENIRIQNTSSIEDMMVHVRAGTGIALVTSDNSCFFDSRYLCIPVPDIGASNYIAAVWSANRKSGIISAFTDLINKRISSSDEQ